MLLPGRACRWLRCPEITRDPSGYCLEHRARARRPYDRALDEKRGSARERGYDTKWDKFREWFMQQPGNQYCHRCFKQGEIVKAEVVHHIIPVSERPDLRLVSSNCQSLCRECHEKVHGRR